MKYKWSRGISIILSAWYFGNAMKQLFVTENIVWEMVYITASALWLGYGLKEES